MATVKDVSGNNISGVDQRIPNVIIPNVGDRMFTVGHGGYFANINDAIEDRNNLENRLELIKEFDDSSILALAGTTTIGITDGTFNTIAQPTGNILNRDSAPWTFDYFIAINDDPEFYKIKEVQTDKLVSIWETLITTNSLGAAGTIKLYKMRRLSLILLPGEHNTTMSEGVSCIGINIIGLDKYNTFLSEAGGTPQGPFTEMLDCVVKGITLAPTDAWAALDSVAHGGLPTTGYSGAINIFDDVVINSTNQGAHGGGSGNIPVPRGGRTVIRNSEIYLDSTNAISLTGRATESAANTLLHYENCFFKGVRSKDLRTGVTNTLALCAIYANQNITYNMFNCFVDFSGLPGVAASAGVRSIVYALDDAASAGAQAPVINLSNVEAKVANTGEACSGVHIVNGVGASTVININHSDIDVNSDVAGNRYGIYNGDNDAVVNVRHSRIAGATASINNASTGTVNYDNATTLIGGAAVGATNANT